MISTRQPSFVKRVIATSGQTVDLKDGKVYVDGRRLDESYAMGESKPLDAHLSSAPDSYPYTIPDGCIWVMGDNRENSADSRYFGPVEEDSVIGIVFARYFPFDRSFRWLVNIAKAIETCSQSHQRTQA